MAPEHQEESTSTDIYRGCKLCELLPTLILPARENRNSQWKAQPAAPLRAFSFCRHAVHPRINRRKPRAKANRARTVMMMGILPHDRAYRVLLGPHWSVAHKTVTHYHKDELRSQSLTAKNFVRRPMSQEKAGTELRT